MKKVTNPCVEENTNISTNKFLCSGADRLSIVHSIYFSIAFPVLDNVPSARDTVVTRPKKPRKQTNKNLLNPHGARSLVRK